MLTAPRASLLGAVLLCLTLPACTTSPDDPGDDLASNRRHWQSQRLADYQVQFRMSCFCVPDVIAPVVLQVRGGAIVSVTRVSDGVAVSPSRWKGVYYTVDQMFALIAAAQAKGADEVRVTYDPLLRYPTTVFIDPSQRLADDEQYFAMSGLGPRR
ncbi:MAG TPA: DUF6174 domain-containing protein [Vicinamibacteria bacterium]|nr:DUF6174 domain-containing protein [Vicinamibacteria bacterium]